MMAKMFYTLDETKAALGKNEEEIKQLAREGRLREFRDGPRLMFKSDQVDNLKAELSGGSPVRDQVDLGPSDSGSPIGLVDSKNASGTSITLSDSDAASRGAPKEDTALAADLGLSGSVGGVPSPGRVNPLSGTGAGSIAGTRGGVNVFSADEVEHADPMAQTSISSSIQDQVNLEGVGSGSGLLDLTRESDDTSLGAELLDEMGAPAGGKRVAAGDSGAAATLAAPAGGVTRAAGPVYVERPDPMAPAFGWLAAAAALVVLFGGFVVISAVVGSQPAFVHNLTSAAGRGWNALMLFGVGLILAVILFVVGLVIGRSAAK